MTSKLDYLRKYMSAEQLKEEDENRPKKKKRKKDEKRPKSKNAGGFKIIDTDIKTFQKVEDGDGVGEFDLEEEKPQIAGIVDERPMEMTGKWRKFDKKDADSEERPKKIRKRHDSSDSDVEVSRRRHDSSDSDVKVSRKRHDSSDSDVKVSRKRHDSSDSDLEVPRKDPDSDLDVERRGKKEDSDASPPRRRISDSDESPPRRDGEKRTLDGKKAGLQSAKGLKAEMEEFRRKERKRIENLSDEVSGKNAETKVRGRLKEKQEEERRKKEKAEIPDHVKKQYDKWGKGLKQIQANARQLESDLHEMSKPLARDANDEDLDAHLKAADREEDPMLAYIQKKKTKNRNPNIPKFPEYKGPQGPPNRFGIKPGYRWDGVDRSTGFEQRLFESQNKRKAIQEEAYLWSTEDM